MHTWTIYLISFYLSLLSVKQYLSHAVVVKVNWDNSLSTENSTECIIIPQQLFSIPRSRIAKTYGMFIFNFTINWNIALQCNYIPVYLPTRSVWEISLHIFSVGSIRSSNVTNSMNMKWYCIALIGLASLHKYFWGLINFLGVCLTFDIILY